MERTIAPPCYTRFNTLSDADAAGVTNHTWTESVWCCLMLPACVTGSPTIKPSMPASHRGCLAVMACLTDPHGAYAAERLLGCMTASANGNAHFKAKASPDAGKCLTDKRFAKGSMVAEQNCSKIEKCCSALLS